MDNSDVAVLKELLDKVRGGDEDSFATLAEMYSPLIRGTASRMGLSVDEVYSDAVLALYRAAVSYDPSKEEVTFGLYAGICIKRRLLDLIRQSKRANGLEEDFDVDRISVDSGILTRLVREEESLWLHSSAKRLLSELEYSVFRLWLEGLKTSGIAEELGIESRSVDNAKARVLKKLREGLPLQRNED